MSFHLKNNVTFLKNKCHMESVINTNFPYNGQRLICSESRSRQWENMSRHPINLITWRKCNYVLPSFDTLHFINNNFTITRSTNELKFRKWKIHVFCKDKIFAYTECGNNNLDNTFVAYKEECRWLWNLGMIQNDSLDVQRLLL